MNIDARLCLSFYGIRQKAGQKIDIGEGIRDASLLLSDGTHIIRSSIVLLNHEIFTKLGERFDDFKEKGRERKFFIVHERRDHL